MTGWYQLQIDEVLAQLETNPEGGLQREQVERRVAQHGPNELIERGLKSPWLILWEQLTALMVVILIIAAGVSAALGDYKDAIAILAIVLLNAVLGYTQEYRAEQAMAALKKLAVPRVKVRRGGHVTEISARELVPGDVVLLEAGGQVPADGRLVESVGLRTQEAALTGESEPVEKSSRGLTADNLPLGDRRNMIYMGTVITSGRGLAVITETGMRTELGRIAEMIQTVAREPTPLQRRLAQLGRGLAAAALVIVVVVLVLGLLRGVNVRLMFLTAISMAVAAVPEGLPAVVTIALALGAQRMLSRRALIRKLPAVETLGSVTVICSDKTGTLTENQMTVTILDVAERTLNVTEALERGQPVWTQLAEAPHPPAAPEPSEATPDSLGLQLGASLRLLLAGSALCNDAILEEEGKESGRLRAVGDPTEGALVVAAAQFDIHKPELERALPRVAEVPFTSERKRMTTAHEPKKDEFDNQPRLRQFVECLPIDTLPPYLAFSKGAVDNLLKLSSQVWVDGQLIPLDDHWQQRIQCANSRLAQDGMRVLGVALRPLQSLPPEDRYESLEQDLIFIGLVGMIDPPRPEVKDAVQTCKAAGIRPVMITGDHPLTAQYIAQQLGITNNDRVLTGQDLTAMSVENLRSVAQEVAVYARVSPEHKLKIVEALQESGHIVSMTGDGINDAPALKKADIGVAMGITGTDVAKEAADMVLMDDNFATIVLAVEEGRVIYDNIRKFIKYTLTSNAGELWVMLVGPLLGMPLPLLPLQILWINLVTDGLPGLALTVEPPERGTMRRPPYPPGENIFRRGLARNILWVGLWMGLVSLGLGFWAWSTGHLAWQTMIFTTLTLSQLGNALAFRSERSSLFRLGLGSNKLMLGTVLVTVALQLMVVYVPFLQRIFEVLPMSGGELAISLVFSTLPFWVIELEKLLVQRSSQSKEPFAR